MSTPTVESAASLRDQFLLDPSVVFLNHGSFGATPKPVFEDYQRWQRELEWQPVEFIGRRYNDLLDAARADLADYLHAEPDGLVYVPNATTGVNIVARSLYLKPGEEVLGNDLEYGACDRAWQYECDRAGATYIRQHIPLPATTPEAIVDAIWAGVTSRTRVIYLSHITSGTALTLPVELVCQRARSEGIFTVIDGAHAPGQLPLDMQAIGADAYTGNLHKWLSAPKGSAFLYVRPEHTGWMESSIVSWGWVETHHDYLPGRQFVSRNQYQGTKDIASFLAVPAAIRFQAEHDWDAVRARCHELAVEARRRVIALWGEEPLSPEPVPGGFPWFVQMVACPLPAVDPLLLKQRMYDEDRVEIPISQYDDRVFVRFSFQGYNTRDDLEAAMASLTRIVPELGGPIVARNA